MPRCASHVRAWLAESHKSFKSMQRAQCKLVYVQILFPGFEHGVSLKIERPKVIRSGFHAPGGLERAIDCQVEQPGPSQGSYSLLEQASTSWNKRLTVFTQAKAASKACEGMQLRAWQSDVLFRSKSSWNIAKPDPKNHIRKTTCNHE